MPRKPSPKPKADKARKAPRPRKAEPAPPGTAMTILEPRYWVRWYRCGCHHHAGKRAELKPWCDRHLLNAQGDDVAVFPGEAFPTRKTMGRPTLYSEQTAELVCQLVASGWKMRDFDVAARRLREDEFEPEECERIAAALPSRATIQRWMGAQPDFRARFARALRAYLEGAGVQEALDIADDGRQDFLFTPKGMLFDAEHVQRSKLRLGFRQWLLERLAAETYGDRKAVDLKVTPGPTGVRQALHNSTDEELEAVLAAHRQLPPPGVQDDPGVVHSRARSPTTE